MANGEQSSVNEANAARKWIKANPRSALSLLETEGYLREQCGRCGCNSKYHDEDKTVCTVCWEWCPYRASYVVVHPEDK